MAKDDIAPFFSGKKLMLQIVRDVHILGGWREGEVYGGCVAEAGGGDGDCSFPAVWPISVYFWWFRRAVKGRVL